jgi:hypothetical protein
LSALLLGAWAGVLIGKRDWDLFDWLNVGCNLILFPVTFAPLFRELYNFLKNDELD